MRRLTKSLSLNAINCRYFSGSSSLPDALKDHVEEGLAQR